MKQIATGLGRIKKVIAGDENSYLLQVIQDHAIPDPKNPNETLINTMPPNRSLKPNIIDVFIRWIMNGMPLTAADAAALFVAPTPVVTPTP